MSNTTALTDAEIQAAWIAANGGKYPPVSEHITIVCEAHPGYSRPDGSLYPFVHHDAIPERFHAHIKALSLGSTCPAPDNRIGLFYTYDVDRWLRAFGVQAELVVSGDSSKE